MLDGAARLLIGQFFERLVGRAAGRDVARKSLWRRLLALLRLG